MPTDECKAIRAEMSKNFTRPPTTFPLEIVRKITDRLFVRRNGTNPRRCLLDVIYSIAPRCSELEMWYFATRETLYHEVWLMDVVHRRPRHWLRKAVASIDLHLAFNPWTKVRSLIIECVCTHGCLSAARID